MWKKVKEQVNLEADFVANETYPEAQLGKMGKTAMKILSLKDEEFYEGMGKYFVQLATDCGYQNLILALGRGIRDFFLNLDNLHDYLKFTFTKMKAPSFFVDTEDEGSIMLQYRTRRRGFHFYVQGQVCEYIGLYSCFYKKREKKLLQLFVVVGKRNSKSSLSTSRTSREKTGMQTEKTGDCL